MLLLTRMLPIAPPLSAANRCPINRRAGVTTFDRRLICPTTCCRAFLVSSRCCDAFAKPCWISASFRSGIEIVLSSRLMRIPSHTTVLAGGWSLCVATFSPRRPRSAIASSYWWAALSRGATRTRSSRYIRALMPLDSSALTI